MDPDDLDKYSSDLNPISAVPRPDRKRKVGENEKHALTTVDIAAMRGEAWNKQRQAQRERRRGGGPAVIIEDMTAAADMELAALGFPYSLKLERSGDRFYWVLIHESEKHPGETAAKSKAFPVAGATPKAVGGLLKDFLTNSIA